MEGAKPELVKLQRLKAEFGELKPGDQRRYAKAMIVSRAGVSSAPFFMFARCLCVCVCSLAVGVRSACTPTVQNSPMVCSNATRTPLLAVRAMSCAPVLAGGSR
jgi:hypothetical protein